MSQQNNQNLSPSNLPNAQTTNTNTTSDQFSSFQQGQQIDRQRTQQQTPQPLSQAQGSPLPQANTAQQQQQQQPATSQIQPAPGQSVSVSIRPPSVAVRGSAKKKLGGGGNKKTTGVRPKPITTEKNDDMGLPQALSKMADDYLNQANQYGKDTPEGQAAYKNYIDSVQALQQHHRNNSQLGNYPFPVVNQQTTSPASTPSPHQVPRIIPSTGPSPLAPQQRPLAYSEYNNIQTIQQLRSELSKITNLLTQDNLSSNVKTELLNRANTLNQLSVVKFGSSSNAGPMQHMSPQSPYNSPRSYLGTQGNDYNRITTASSQSPSSPLANSTGVSSSHLQDGSIITSPTMQQPHPHQAMQQQIQQLQQSHNNPQSPSSQQPPQSPLSQQNLPPSPRTQQPSQPPQSQPPRLTQQKHIHPHLAMNPSIMDIDSLPSTSPKIVPRPVSDMMASTSVGTGGMSSRQITPIAPANQTGLLSIISKMQQPISGIKNPNLPETPASLSLTELDDGDRQLLSKRKIQQLVDQIDPKERLEPEVEDILLEIADEFISSVSSFACLLAKHRKSDTLEVKDLQLHLERNWNIRIPGFASDEIRSVRKTAPNAHQQKLLAVNTAKANKAQMATMAPTVTSAPHL